ncbi:MAG: hypothetical protein KAG66_07520, partial [Methylococcales bacterium]|nr:hypothetical protein [Methylococcales bacterium]
MTNKAHHHEEKASQSGQPSKSSMIETISAEELARDPGYPGMVPGHVAQTVYYAPFKKLTEA